MTASTDSVRPVTLTEWLAASPDARQRALGATREHIARTDPSVHAWVRVAPQPPTRSGPLDGVPFGVKDILDTAGLPTEFGSPLYAGRRTDADAPIVSALRERGAIVLGKTHTAAFAYRAPAPTRNPRNLAHTPGGSSSGSAAVVAADMVPFATGTQTLGSVVRPASFCGVTGFKATHGLLGFDGVLPCAKSLDTLGFFTHTAADMLALWDALGHPTGTASEADAIAFAAPDPLPDLEPPMAAAFGATIARLRAAGVDVRGVDVARLLADLAAAASTVMFYEGARFHEDRYRAFGDKLDDLAALVRQGLATTKEQYEAARHTISAARTRMAETFAATPVVLVPAAPGPAPYSLASTGDARMNSPWTALGTPAISIPMPVGDALPLGLQLVSAPGEDARVLRAGARLERILAATKT
ncbi:MAG: amidase [Armatimonadetes bacterium]|nr:amidase [Armatimonadota bacterium]